MSFPSLWFPYESRPADLSCSFGAVLEEFELRDAIENIFSGRPEAMVF